MFRRIATAWAAIMIFASPVGAQSQADQPASAAPALPPNFVPPPPARLYDNYPRRSHHGATRHERTSQHQHATEHRATARHHKATERHQPTQHQSSRHKHDTHRHRTANSRSSAHHHGTTERKRQAHERQKPLHLSKRTIRQCQDMSYKQIMRHSSCRALMKQELEAGDRQQSRASRHHSSAKDRSSAHHRSKPHQQTTHHHDSTRHHETTHRRSAKRHRD